MMKLARGGNRVVACAERLAGILVFAAALVVYWLTAERTISFWDCPEYVINGALLEPGHPPGNPTWTLAMRVAAVFCGVGEHTAFVFNKMSGLFTALAVWLAYCILTRCLRYCGASGWRLIAAGAAGALCMAWSDTVWYSAVEAEVYAMSLLFTVLTVWLALVWAGRPRGSSPRLLVLVAYVAGLGVGIHQLNLLCLPAVALIVVWKLHSGRSWKLTAAALLASLGVLALLLYGLMPGLPALAAGAEIFATGSLGWPRHLAAVAAVAAVIALFATGGLVLPRLWARTASWCVALFCVGYCVFALVIVRGAANPPLNTGWPGNVISFSAYSARDQYGSSALVHGPSAWSQRLQKADGTPATRRGKELWAADSAGGYRMTGYRLEPVYAPQQDIWMPRLGIRSEADKIAYQDWAGTSEEALEKVSFPVRADSAGQAVDGPMRTGFRPTVGQNLKFLFGYQLSYMYLRYLAWNFIGRQNDRASQGQVEEGNFITGVKPLDELMLGPQAVMPPDMGRGARGRAAYFGIPFLLGLLGIAGLTAARRRSVQAKRVDFGIFVLFVMTGLAIAFYLNMGSVQARERDYAFVGSFFAFSLWIGCGAWVLLESARRKAAVALAGLLVAATPTIMLCQNYEAHDRSGRTLARDFGWNILQSLEPEAILFVSGDNVTFPLWYLQEVEGVRRDVRVVSLAYLVTDWYAGQLRVPAWDSPGVTLTPGRVFSRGERRRSELVADIIANRGSRPVYWVEGLSAAMRPEQQDSLWPVGLALRYGRPEDPFPDTDLWLYEFRYGNLSQGRGVYVDDASRNAIRLMRRVILQRADSCLRRGEIIHAVRLLDHSLLEMPPKAEPLTSRTLDGERFNEAIYAASLYRRAYEATGNEYLLGRAYGLALKGRDRTEAYRKYYLSLPPRLRRTLDPASRLEALMADSAAAEVRRCKALLDEARRNSRLRENR